MVERIREMNEISCRAGAVILLALSFLMPTFSYIPKSVLGAVIVTSVFPMIEFHEILPLWKGRRKSLFHFSSAH
jgi:solute carrier family 26 (sodium-independent sulfate anion transporter), member 11